MQQSLPLFAHDGTPIINYSGSSENCDICIEFETHADGEFIANAPADVAALVAEVRRLRREVDKLGAEIYRLVYPSDDFGE